MSPVRTLVCVPTYDEIESLPPLLARLLAARPDVDVLVLDDGSPDGTGAWAQERAAGEPRLHVLHRSGKQGLGAAYLAGFAWALERGYDVVCEMDADGSHAPEQLGGLLDAVAAGADLAIGSRWVRGGEVRNWPWTRRLLSRGGNTYTRLVLGIGVHDATAGYRAFSARALRTLPLADVASAGYCFQVDLAWRASPLRPAGRRGADHLRRARGGRLEDVGRDRAGGAVAGHRVGPGAPAAAAAGRRPPAPRGPRTRLSPVRGARTGLRVDGARRGAATQAERGSLPSRSSDSRSSSRTSSSAMVRRSSSMSQWVRCGRVGLGSGRVASRSRASAPQRHSHSAGTSASTEKGTTTVWPLGQM